MKVWKVQLVIDGNIEEVKEFENGTDAKNFVEKAQKGVGASGEELVIIAPTGVTYNV